MKVTPGYKILFGAGSSLFDLVCSRLAKMLGLEWQLPDSLIYLAVVIGTFFFIWGCIDFYRNQPKGFLRRTIKSLKRWGLVWSYDRFIWITGSQNSLFIVAFEATLTNRTSKTLENISGDLQSHVTGKRIPLYSTIGGHPCPIEEVQLPPGRTISIRAPFRGDFGKTFGEPPLLPLDERKNWEGFTFTFKYDGKTHRKIFSAETVRKQISDRENEIRANLQLYGQQEKSNLGIDLKKPGSRPK